jgi:cysteine desulfurase
VAALNRTTHLSRAPQHVQSQPTRAEAPITPCVAKPAQELARTGWKVRKLAVGADGRVDLADVERALTQPTRIVSVMLANNETGAIQDVAAVAEKARAARAWMHTDAVQALGKIGVDFNTQRACDDMSAHKIYGPKVWAHSFSTSALAEALVDGGSHEHGLRSGTENAGRRFGAACGSRRDACMILRRLAAMRDQFERGLAQLGAVVFCAGTPRIPNTSYFAFSGVEGETLVVELDKAGFAVASGAACSSANPEPSATLLAMGVAPELARSAVRLSLGKDNTAAQIEEFLHALSGVLTRLMRLTAIAV